MANKALDRMPRWFDRHGLIQQLLKVMRLVKQDRRFVKTGLQILFYALLSVETEGCRSPAHGVAWHHWPVRKWHTEIVRVQTSSFVHAAFRLDDFTTASMKAMPRTASSIFG